MPILKSFKKPKGTNLLIVEEIIQRIRDIRSYGIVQRRTAKIRARSLSFDKLFINDCGFTWDEANNDSALQKKAERSRPQTLSQKTNNTKRKCQKHINKENLESLILKHAPDIVALTETWLTPHIFNREIAPSNYSVIHNRRLSRVGGIAVLIKNTIAFTPSPAVADAEAVFSRIIAKI